MTEGSGAGRSQAPDGQGQRSIGLSEFAGKLLDQLSVSAWLPAAMLAGNLVVLIKVRTQQNPNLTDAIGELTDDALATLVGAVFAVILTTIVTQAFSFESIRILEGYWGMRLAKGPTKWRVARHTTRCKKLREKHDQLEKEAFDKARRAMLKKNYSREEIDLAENWVYGRKEGLSRDERLKASQVRWKWHAEPHLVRRLEELSERTAAFPPPHRILPTRLGNLLRATEDRLSQGRYSHVENFVHENYDKVSFKLRIQHDQFRGRLDMYCTLVFVFVALAIAGPLIVSNTLPWIRVVLAAVYAALAAVSYEAAITSARGYCSILIAMRNATKPVATEQTSSERRTIATSAPSEAHDPDSTAE